MRNEELIAKAKEHANAFEQSDPNPLPFGIRDLLKIRVRETVTVYFESDQRAERIEICLDKISGDFLGASYIPAK